MNDPRPPASGRDPGPDAPWYLRRPASDDETGIARPRPTPPRRYPPPADVPWYLQRPDRPPPPTPEATPQKRTVRREDRNTANPRRLLPWLLVGAGALALLAGIAVLVSGITKLGTPGGTFLDVAKVQTGVLQTLSDPASGYGANTVSDVSCNNGHNPSAAKGTTFACDATVNGAQRHVNVVVSDDSGTYEIDGPR